MATFVAPEAVGVIAQAGPPQYLAEHLARVFGTEEDPVNCSFFFKVGACRNGDRCGKKHNHPSSSQTLLLTSLYPGTPEGICIANEQPWDDSMYDRAQAHLEAFYEEVVLVLAEYGEIEEVVVVDNTIDYMLGNVYVRYRHENSACGALVGLTGRYYFGKLISAEYSPVADFREARCRAHHETRCSRVGACRFLHIKHVPKSIKRRVARQMYKEHPEFLMGRRRDVDPSERALAKMNLADNVDNPMKIRRRGVSMDRAVYHDAPKRGRTGEATSDPYGGVKEPGGAYDPEYLPGQANGRGRRFTEQGMAITNGPEEEREPSPEPEDDASVDSEEL